MHGVLGAHCLSAIRVIDVTAMLQTNSDNGEKQQIDLNHRFGSRKQPKQVNDPTTNNNYPR